MPLASVTEAETQLSASLRWQEGPSRPLCVDFVEAYSYLRWHVPEQSDTGAIRARLGSLEPLYNAAIKFLGGTSGTDTTADPVGAARTGPKVTRMVPARGFRG